MLEWLKRHAWKACVPLKGTAGSNPAFSAKIFRQTSEARSLKTKKDRIKLA